MSSSIPPTKTFWQAVKESAENVMKGPKWMTAGISLNPDIYETYPPETPSESKKKP